MNEPTSGDECREYLRVIVPSVVAALDEQGHSVLQQLDAYTLIAGLLELRLEGHTEITLTDLDTIRSSSLTDEAIHERLAELETLGIVERYTSNDGYSYRLVNLVGWTRYPMLTATSTKIVSVEQNHMTTRPVPDHTEDSAVQPAASSPIAVTNRGRYWSKTGNEPVVSEAGTVVEPRSAAIDQPARGSLVLNCVQQVTRQSPIETTVSTTTPSTDPTQYTRVSSTASTTAMASGAGGFSLVFVSSSPIVPKVLWTVMWLCLCLWVVTAGVDRLARRWGDPAEWFLEPSPQ